MFFDAQQTEQALWQHQPPQRPADPLRPVVEVVAAYMLGRSIGKLFQKQADDATHRCW